MTAIVPAVIEWGPWAIIGALVAAYLWSRHTGSLVTRGDVERIERRIEKDTDRVLELYKNQIASLEKVIERKDATILKQAEQIEKLMSHSAVSAHALEQIMEEARKRGALS